MDVLSHGRFVATDVLSLRTFCPTDVLSTDVLSPDVLSPDILSGYRFLGWDISGQYFYIDILKDVSYFLLI
jgi:hypothetical protein